MLETRAGEGAHYTVKHAGNGRFRVLASSFGRYCVTVADKGASRSTGFLPGNPVGREQDAMQGRMIAGASIFGFLEG
ncbi:MAG: hypothetical protein L6Q55_10225 [Azonexus sp.]|nr:hypothetical protein [Azonexus sp.]MCK6412783.1 hypothetical protein [Azonexus sp.]